MRTRWRIALGLAQCTKLNFNVTEQLNDWGLIRTHSLFTGLKASKLNCHKHLVQNYHCGFKRAAHLALKSWANLNGGCPESTNCMSARSHLTQVIISHPLDIRPGFLLACLFFFLIIRKIHFSLASANSIYWDKQNVLIEFLLIYFILFKSVYSNDWVHNSFHPCAVSPVCLCVWVCPCVCLCSLDIIPFACSKCNQAYVTRT